MRKYLECCQRNINASPAETGHRSSPGELPVKLICNITADFIAAAADTRAQSCCHMG